MRAEDDTPRHGQQEGHGTGNEQIRGSMSLAEIETATGVSAKTLKSELGLPEGTAAEERLGRLARQYGFTVDKVREVIKKHQPGTQVAP
jgi:hypothetical protein